MINKAIGGYLELELNCTGEYHAEAIALNTARNAFEYVLKVRAYKKVYIPYYTCVVMLEPIKKLNIDFEFYAINEYLEPIFDYNKIMGEQGFLYTNYFGLKDDFIKQYSAIIPNLIIDNAQSFFSESLNDIDTFYSARKFFGVSDGAYLYSNLLLEAGLAQDESYERMTHLLIRADKSAEAGYADFCLNDSSLNNQPIKKMSNLTQKILCSIDYDKAKRQRIENFNFLHDKLKDVNLLKIEEATTNVPLVYPFWTKDASLKKRLLDNKIYCATYWPNVLDWCTEASLEADLTKEVIHLPIDQRYSEAQMRFMINIIKL
jgi:hypothetical protein